MSPLFGQTLPDDPHFAAPWRCFAAPGSREAVLFLSRFWFPSWYTTGTLQNALE